MDVPEDFQFTENAAVNRFATERAVLMFGKDWQNAAGMVVRHPDPNSNIVSHNQSGWELHIFTEMSGSHHYIVSSMKNGGLENPSTNVAARVIFHSNGKPSYQAHYLLDRRINPPDGSPSFLSYKANGNLGECHYVDSTGNATPVATPDEIAKRMDKAKHNTAAALCEGTQDIIALELGLSQSSITKNSGSTSQLQRL